MAAGLASIQGRLKKYGCGGRILVDEFQCQIVVVIGRICLDQQSVLLHNPFSHVELMSRVCAALVLFTGHHSTVYVNVSSSGDSIRLQQVVLSLLRLQRDFVAADPGHCKLAPIKAAKIVREPQFAFQTNIGREDSPSEGIARWECGTTPSCLPRAGRARQCLKGHWIMKKVSYVRILKYLQVSRREYLPMRS